MKFKTVIVVLLFSLVLLAVFSVGYYWGGYDTAYQQHLIQGKISAAANDSCGKKEDPLSCHESFRNSDIYSALSILTWGHSTPIADVIIGDFSILQERVKKDLLEYAINHDGWGMDCQFGNTGDIDIVESCKETNKAIQLMIEEYSNQSLQPTADASAE